MGNENLKYYDGSKAFGIVILTVAFLVFLAGISLISGSDIGLLILMIAVIVILTLIPLSLRIVNEWERVVVMRLGKYVGILNPGTSFIIPIIEYTPFTVDMRVRSTPFNAEKTLTKDNVPVDVDAILFWQVKNPEEAVLNVQDYMQSIQLASQTALRDVIGKTELSEMLAGREKIGEEIKNLIEERVAGWGIEAISVEIRDVTIPPELQEAMAKVATSDREKQARIILAESESLAADKMLEAAKKYEKDPYAMQLRSLNMMYEISMNGKNLMIFIPTESKGFSIPLPFGVMGVENYSSTKGKGKREKQG
jgi:regulator of protease activity HflC (stomatin/prohibitin superfamily)